MQIVNDNRQTLKLLAVYVALSNLHMHFSLQACCFALGLILEAFAVQVPYLPILFRFAMAVHPDDMDYDAFKSLCDGLVCRALSSPVVTVEQHPGGFTSANFPATECSANDNAGVHFFDVVHSVREPIN